VPVALRVLAITLLAFAGLLGNEPGVLAARAFFVWTSVLNLVAISLFWSATTDAFRPAEAPRVFGAVAACGTLGAIVGSLIVSVGATVGSAPLVVVAALLLEAAARLMGVLLAGRCSSESPSRRLGLFAAARNILSSPYLGGIAAYVALFTSTSSILYFEQAGISGAALADHAARTALFARMDLAANVLGVALQAVVTRIVLRRIGMAWTLAIVPLATLGALVALRSSPTIAVLVIVQVGRRSLDYAFARPAREVLFTAVSAEDRYEAKSVIDTFVYRAGDAVAATAVEAVGAASAAVLPIAMGVSLAWCAVAVTIGKRYGRLAK
jgi:AAA family ATP:ADP antiporter